MKATRTPSTPGFVNFGRMMPGGSPVNVGREMASNQSDLHPLSTV
jgi:hypothetical protein